MAVDIEPHATEGVSSLISGIVDDARQLLVEQLTLFQVEIRNDARRAARALIPLVCGAIVCVGAVLLLGTAGAQLLCWIFPGFPSWAGYALVGGLIAVAGIGLLARGIVLLESIHPTPDTALDALKETFDGRRRSASRAHEPNA